MQSRIVVITTPAVNVNIHPTRGAEVPEEDPDYNVDCIRIDSSDSETGWRIQCLDVLGSLPKGRETVDLELERSRNPFSRRYHLRRINSGSGWEIPHVVH